jgi:DNA processing protein
LLDKPLVAIVGARNASAAACRFARQLAYDLASRGRWSSPALLAGSKARLMTGRWSGTIGVVAGVSTSSTSGKRGAAEGDFERGLVIAEMPPGTEPRARHFPYRNRIIAGLTGGTVVVEAAPKSRSLITARLAAEAGREVMAVPGSFAARSARAGLQSADPPRRDFGPERQ